MTLFGFHTRSLSVTSSDPMSLIFAVLAEYGNHAWKRLSLHFPNWRTTQLRHYLLMEYERLIVKQFDQIGSCHDL